LKKSRFKLADNIDECCNHLNLNAEYHLTVQGDVSVEVVADRNKIDQVLVNFVNNAVKYAPESKEITILLEQLPQKVKVSVIDKGQGIPEQNIPHLFNRYYQVKNEQTKVKGLGLGLYISAEIIKKHQGEIGVDSVLGKGSTFWFTLPTS
jgi:two-component system CheB/CheR fusion protein